MHRTKEECTLQILNPDLRLTCHVIKATPYEQTEFDLHIKELKQLGIIAYTQSPHRTKAFIVKKHNEIIRGKSRMVFNYKRLNDNTEEDKYPLPNKEALINKIKHTYLYSKFDLKSGFWQVKMAKESRKWTAFITHNGHYEWKVMLFGLKNAP